MSEKRFVSLDFEAIELRQAATLQQRWESLRAEFANAKSEWVETSEEEKDEIMRFYLEVHPQFYVEMATLRAARVDLRAFWRVALHDMLKYQLHLAGNYKLLNPELMPANRATT